MARPKLPLVLSPLQKQELTQLVKAPSTPQKMARRGQIVLLAAAGLDNTAIARRAGTSAVSVGQWRQRFLDSGMAGLHERPRSGRKKSISADKLDAIVTRVVQPPKGRKRWSCRRMAREVGVSKDTVARVWRTNDLKPHLRRVFKVSQDPNFEPKFWDVIGLYLDPPICSVVLCCDEKSQCQALERTQPGLPLGQGHIRTQTHDYYRHGTSTLFAALDYLRGKVFAQQLPRHRHQEWLKFLRYLDQQIEGHLDVHLIADNYATHKHAKVKAWLTKHPRFQMHFTPTSASWMNLVERFFGELTQDVILPGSFASVRELTDAIAKHLAEHNLKPKRYVWRADGQTILNKINRARQALAHEPAIDKDISATPH